MTANHDEDLAVLERRRDAHHAQASRHRQQAVQAEAAGDNTAGVAWAKQADAFDALAADDERRIRVLRDRQRATIANAVHNRQVVSPDLTR